MLSFVTYRYHCWLFYSNLSVMALIVDTRLIPPDGSYVTHWMRLMDQEGVDSIRLMFRLTETLSLLGRVDWTLLLGHG